MSRTVLDHETGFFNMSIVDNVLTASSLESAKQMANDAIEQYEKSHASRKENLTKARSMVLKSKSKQQLAFGLSNFILSFQGLRKI